MARKKEEKRKSRKKIICSHSLEVCDIEDVILVNVNTKPPHRTYINKKYKKLLEKNEMPRYSLTD